MSNQYSVKVRRITIEEVVVYVDDTPEVQDRMGCPSDAALEFAIGNWEMMKSNRRVVNVGRSFECADETLCIGAVCDVEI